MAQSYPNLVQRYGLAHGPDLIQGGRPATLRGRHGVPGDSVAGVPLDVCDWFTPTGGATWHTAADGAGWWTPGTGGWRVPKDC